MEEVRPGLIRWTARHPEWELDDGGWDPEVASYAFESRDGLIVFDPLVLDDDVWRALDERVARLGPPHVLLTLFWHVRSTPEVVERYPGTRVWVDVEQTGEIAKRVAHTDTLEPGDALPGGVEARRPRELVYWIPDHRALVIGDVLLGADGGVRVMPDSWLGPKRPRDRFRANMRELTELPTELLLLTHGEAIENGREALVKALEE